MSGAKRTALQILIVVLLVGSAAVSVQADDFSVPPWRGTEGSTFQQWSFTTDDYGPMEPDEEEPPIPAGTYFNPQGTPLLRVDSGSLWHDVYDSHTGVWGIANQMDAIIPNYLDLNYEKEIWVQVLWTFRGEDEFIPDTPLVGITPFYHLYGPGGGGGIDYSVHITRTDRNAEDPGWTSTLFKINVYPNPSEEWITIKGDILVDQVVIDTVCTPEPATLALISGGALLALRRGRKA